MVSKLYMGNTKIKSHWNEVWKKVETKAPTVKCDYFFSNYGRVKSINKTTDIETLLKCSNSKQIGYKVLNIRLEGGLRQGIYVHHLVAKAFVEKPSEKHKFAIHLDRNKFNNYWENLQWMTRQEMVDMQVVHGVYKNENRKTGKQVKMTETKVKLLKQRLKKGKTKKKVLAKNFGITVTQLKRIERGENWGYVTI